MHKLLVPASPALERSAVAAWIAEAVGRREKVLYKHAPTEDAAAVLAELAPAAIVASDLGRARETAAAVSAARFRRAASTDGSCVTESVAIAPQPNPAVKPRPPEGPVADRPDRAVLALIPTPPHPTRSAER